MKVEESRFLKVDSVDGIVAYENQTLCRSEEGIWTGN